MSAALKTRAFANYGENKNRENANGMCGRLEQAILKSLILADQLDSRWDLAIYYGAMVLSCFRLPPFLKEKLSSSRGGDINAFRKPLRFYFLWNSPSSKALNRKPFQRYPSSCLCGQVGKSHH